MPTIPCKSAVYHPPVGAYFFVNVQYFRRFSVPHCVMKHTLALLCLLALALAGRAQHQLPNPGFELWDGGVTSEPTHWNSFASSDGSFSSLADSPHHYRRNGGRPGSDGSHYLTIYTTSILGIKANGNMTTGRIHAGSMSASSSDNYNHTQRSNASHCQPFSGTPDSLYVWVSFYASSASAQAQVSAILHGDNDFRAPNQENRPDLYCGKAQARFTRTTGSPTEPHWQLLKVPFLYDGQSDPRYLLVNLTTNATPGGGSANDSLSIDDIRFVYSAWLNDILVDGRPIDGFRKGRTDYTVHVDEPRLLADPNLFVVPEARDASVAIDRQPLDDTSSLVTLTVTAEDTHTVRTYHLTLTTGHPAGASHLDIQPPTSDLQPLTFFPNPASGRITVRAAADVSLLDCSGRRLQHFKNQNSEFTIDLSGLPAGTYLLHSQGLTRTLVKHR